MPSATSPELRNPWQAFLVDVDRCLPFPIEIHCLGGFVAAFYYDLPRPTNDLDYIEVVPHDAMATVQEVAGVESALAIHPMNRRVSGRSNKALVLSIAVVEAGDAAWAAGLLNGYAIPRGALRAVQLRGLPGGGLAPHHG
ncbi:MAG: hypothetical protein ACREF4_02360 [Gammaproteobacteria bacterium]